MITSDILSPVTGEIMRPIMCGAASTVAYGTIWDQATDTYQIGTVKNGAFIEEELASFPIQEQMKRCVLSDAGVRQYYLLPTDSTKKADGSAAVLDGTDGQVMVEIPRFWYIQCHYGTKRYFFIGDGPFLFVLPDGSVEIAAIHPFFFKGGASSPVIYRYIGAYEAAMYDDSAGEVVSGAGVISNIYSAGDKMCSVSGQYPKTAENITEFRAMAAARATGWHQYDSAACSALSILYLTEYADFNTQSKIGAGRTGLSDGAWEAGSYIAATGLSNAIGDATGNVSAGGAGGIPTDFMSYRGVENWYGNIWKFLDGANIHNSVADGSRLYLCNDHSKYVSDTDADYTLAGLLPETDGYPTDIIDALGFWPSAVGGNSATYLCDYYYTYFDNNPASGWRIALVGGYATAGANAGAFYLSSNYGSATAYADIGGRLCF